MAMSGRARRSLRPDQVAAIEESCEIVAVDIPTDRAGGRVGALHDRRHPPRPARPVTAEPELTEAVEAINEEHPTTQDGQDVFLADAHA